MHIACLSRHLSNGSTLSGILLLSGISPTIFPRNELYRDPAWMQCGHLLFCLLLCQMTSGEIHLCLVPLKKLGCDHTGFPNAFPGTDFYASADDFSRRRERLSTSLLSIFALIEQTIIA